ncbi:MAG TPA: hypothetical protein VE422_48595 [Terriglobia bacterium]|nr:hypothetical protein [Terriglobia bacterium]
MIVIELQYDAYNRTFKPLDSEAGGIFEHSGVYLAVIPDPGTEPHFESIDLRAGIAHA